MARSPTASAPAASAQMPSPSLLANFRQELEHHAPFAQMDAGAVDFFLTHCRQRYYAIGDVLVQPADGVVQEIFFIRRGAVIGVRGLADLSGGAFEYEAGVLFPLSAAVAQRAVTATYTAAADTFVLALPCGAMRELAQLSPTFADFLNRRIATLLELSRRALQIAYSSQTLAEQSLESPLRELQPVHTLTTADTAHDAAMLMSRHGIRHVPVTRDGVAVGLVSERDLFAMQRLSLKQVGTSIRAAADIDTLKMVAQDIRRFARNLLSQGVQARQLTSLISHLNDVLTRRLLELKAIEHGVALAPLCWLALGSEGRSEQTIATDQDNALILPDGTSEAQRQAVLAFAHDVNLALDACGYPLCRGGVMAGQPGCCLTLRQWRERFAHWIEYGAPRDLLNASIYFDLRPIAGDEQAALALRAEVFEAARRTPRFLKQMAQNALSHGAPLNWLGGIDVDQSGTLDLKLQGTAIFVDAARLYSLAHGTVLASTRERLESAGKVIGLAPAEYEAWVGGFEFLQMLRLRVQLEDKDHALSARPNRLVVPSLNDIDRRILKESLRVARSLQQRLQLDCER